VAKFDLGGEERNLNIDDEEHFRGTENHEWPVRDDFEPRWLHGDYLAPALPYVFRLYEDVSEKGDLK